jgi:hypothetical protein
VVASARAVLPDPAEEPALEAAPLERRWLAESLRTAAAETILYLRTVAAVSLRPARFAARWLREEQRALNPLGYFATSVSLMAVVYSLLVRWLHLPGGNESFLAELLDASGPYLHYAALGLITHALLRLGGSQRTVTGSLAIALYVGGGPATLVTILNLAIYGLARGVLHRTEFVGTGALRPGSMALVVVAYASRVYMFVAFIRGLAGLHGIKARWVTLAFAVALVVMGLVFGLLNPPGHYGLRLLIGATIRGRRIWLPSWGGL